ncbi:hypothetical protein N8J89_12830 [Crossiella sp. CA-258035]|uniref:hypothetical protein n=1 Tax=Crossiella sp. CA-258035 TaxID=2981138 RepID=UPI0024BC71B2|nr:hypothetical protein [Crossiella sp. CA-258035]WHT21905.1 hypothetical protein N8J89_12830 [Crossiella sp. CA-258035]
MPTPTTTPAAKLTLAQRREREHLRACAHEAGHAVLMAHYNLPITEAIATVNNPIFFDPQAFGYVSEDHEPDDTHIPAELIDDYIVTYLAGGEAQAQWMHQAEGMELAEARREALYNSGSDYEVVRRYRRNSDLSLAQLQARTAGLVRRRWAGITRVAAALHRHKRLTGPQILALLGR